MYHAATYFGSAVVFYVLYLLSDPVSSIVVGKKYDALDRKQKVLWGSCVVSTLHALFTSQGGIRALMDDDFRNDPLLGYSDFGGWYTAVFSGYILYDLILTLRYMNPLYSTAMLIHHVICLLMTAFPLTDTLQHRFLALGCIFLINELSTPFLNHRHFLRLLGVPYSHPQFQITNICFAVSFFFSRVVVEAYALWIIFQAKNFDQLGPVYRYAVVIIPFFFFLLQCYWFGLIVQRAIGSGSKKPKTASSPKTGSAKKD